MDELHAFLFWTIAAMTGLCAVAVVVSQNIVRSATWLLFTLAGTSGIFFLLGADLVGAIQLLVYVGGTLVLVVFGVMLTAQGPFITMKTSAAEWAISAVVGMLLLAVLGVSVVQIGKKADPPKDSTVAKYAPKKILSDDPEKAPYSSLLGQGFLGVGVGPAHKDPDDSALKREKARATQKSPEEMEKIKGKVVRMNYLLPFEIVSVHLLVVLIGAAYLARAKRRRAKE